MLFLVARSNDEEVSARGYTGRDAIVEGVGKTCACILVVQFGRINIH